MYYYRQVKLLTKSYDSGSDKLKGYRMSLRNKEGNVVEASPYETALTLAYEQKVNIYTLLEKKQGATYDASYLGAMSNSHREAQNKKAADIIFAEFNTVNAKLQNKDTDLVSTFTNFEEVDNIEKEESDEAEIENENLESDLNNKIDKESKKLDSELKESNENIKELQKDIKKIRKFIEWESSEFAEQEPNQLVSALNGLRTNTDNNNFKLVITDMKAMSTTDKKPIFIMNNGVLSVNPNVVKKLMEPAKLLLEKVNSFDQKVKSKKNKKN